MKTVQVIRRERFNAAHRLFNPNWSDEKNEQIFGKCANKNWHGHNYTLFVTVEGTVDPDTGYVIDLKILSDIIKNRIVDKMDHKNLNLEVDFMKDTITTAENISIKIYEELERDIQATGNNLYSVKLYETENNYVEYYG
ncbi:MAG TPA: 6-pyruvoyl tetrahydrobiopterin synthase [Flavobacteriales bacterium]|nr:6-pyruvoyl tetrahydrobiopterin synthase [Flavobacteriales bacterium]|tara:strand:+ start:6866 stop:7282 length:417 start_codon:yes stop_codon:yes gene_type:complete